MVRGRSFFHLILSVVAPFLLACARGQTNAYRMIVERNAFGLRPIPPHAESATPAPAGARSKITLTGITTILGDKRVLLKESPPPGNPGEPATSERWYELVEGQADGGVEVLKVDEVASVVTFRNAGVVEQLSLKSLWEITSAPLGPPPPPAVLPIPARVLALR